VIFDRHPPLELVRELFAEYARSIGVAIDERSPNYSLIVVAMEGCYPAGCAAMRELEPEIAEMKRVYVRPDYRGTGLGRRLAEHVIQEARARGYAALRLDTLPAMETAVAMYRSLGFREIPAYHDNPLPGMLYFELDLSASLSHGTI
jgi:ribosomal protein S18 acetylase RimI-like enzyme